MTAVPGGDLVIVGAGGFGRETVDAVHAMNSVGASWRLLGYLDDDPALAGSVIDGVTVLGGLEELGNLPNASVVVCTGRPDNYTSRARIVTALGLPARRYATVIHPTAAVSASSRVGPGSVLLAHVAMTVAVSIGAHVAVMPHVTLTHDNVVDDFATIASGAHLGGRVHICPCGYVGAGALVREGQTVGACAMVGMGSVVLSDVPAGEVWVGVPARYLRRAYTRCDHMAEAP